MGLPDDLKTFKIGLVVLIQYRRVTDTQPPTQPPSQTRWRSICRAYCVARVKSVLRFFVWTKPSVDQFRFRDPAEVYFIEISELFLQLTSSKSANFTTTALSWLRAMQQQLSCHTAIRCGVCRTMFSHVRCHYSQRKVLLISGSTAARQVSGCHNLTPDWPMVTAFGCMSSGL